MTNYVNSLEYNFNIGISFLDKTELSLGSTNYLPVLVLEKAPYT